MNAVIAAVDSQSAAGTLEIGTSGMSTVLVSIMLQKPSFSESAGVITMLGVPLSGVAGNTGSAAAGRIKDGSGAVQVSGLTVGTTSADIILNSVSISSGQMVTLTAGTITHAP